MNILKATADFEQWLARRLPIVRQDIALKHQHMAEAAETQAQRTLRIKDLHRRIEELEADAGATGTGFVPGDFDFPE